MRSTISITAPFAEAGVKTTIEQLKIALKKEGFRIVELIYDSYTFWKQFIHDIENLERLISSDAIIYAASIPQLSAFIPVNKPALLFVHGLILHEYKNSFLYEKRAFDRTHALIYLALFNFVRKKRGIYYICRSLTPCQASGIKLRYIILPQFVLDEDIEYFSRFISSHSNNVLRIISYTSIARSPRLLSQEDLISIAKLIDRKYNGRTKIEFLVVNPIGKKEKVIEMDRVTLRIIGHIIPREDFLELVASSTIYFDTCVDEEMKISSLEAGLMGVPILKLVHPMYRERIQFDEKALITAYSIKGLVDRITSFLEDPISNRRKYSSRIRKWVIENRHWNSVKKPLLDILRG